MAPIRRGEQPLRCSTPRLRALPVSIRQLVRHWAMRAGINVSKRRAARLREKLAKQTWKAGHLPKFRGSIVKRGGEGQGRRPLSCDIRKVIFIGNAGNDQSLGQLLWTGVVPNETFRGSGKGGVSQCRLRWDPTPGARGSRTLAVIVQSKVRAVTDGGPNRFTVADAPEIVRRSMARANHVGLPLKRSYAVNPSTVHERNWRR